MFACVWLYVWNMFCCHCMLVSASMSCFWTKVEIWYLHPSCYCYCVLSYESAIESICSYLCHLKIVGFAVVIIESLPPLHIEWPCCHMNTCLASSFRYQTIHFIFPLLYPLFALSGYTMGYIPAHTRVRRSPKYIYSTSAYSINNMCIYRTYTCTVYVPIVCVCLIV